MRFEWTFAKETPQQIKYFVKELGVSKALLAKIKFQGGRIEVNGYEQNVLHQLIFGDKLTLFIPAEKAHNIFPEEAALDLHYEDEHFLIVNKPSKVASIPSQFHPNKTMASRVKNYLVKNNYENQVVHVVTRLDRDTTGLMLFAKHSFAHALMDKQLREKVVVKKYQALVGGKIKNLKNCASIQEPIARDKNSLLKRKVDVNGKKARTDYWLEKKKDVLALVTVQLYTGRTHQIRVHFEHIDCPLLGDEMYGGDMNRGISRQALHCSELRFIHPFLKKEMTFKQDMPVDMKLLV